MSENGSESSVGAAWVRELIVVLTASWQTIVATTVIAVVLSMIVGAVYLQWGQLVRHGAVLPFRPSFQGAQVGRYPNGLPFGSTDIVTGPVIEDVWNRNTIGDFCSIDAFRSRFFVEEHSMARCFLRPTIRRESLRRGSPPLIANDC